MVQSDRCIRTKVRDVHVIAHVAQRLHLSWTHKSIPGPTILDLIIPATSRSLCRPEETVHLLDLTITQGTPEDPADPASEVILLLLLLGILLSTLPLVVILLRNRVLVILTTSEEADDPTEIIGIGVDDLLPLDLGNLLANDLANDLTNDQTNDLFVLSLPRLIHHLHLRELEAQLANLRAHRITNGIKYLLATNGTSIPSRLTSTLNSSRISCLLGTVTKRLYLDGYSKYPRLPNDRYLYSLDLAT